MCFHFHLVILLGSQNDKLTTCFRKVPTSWERHKSAPPVSPNSSKSEKLEVRKKLLEKFFFSKKFYPQKFLWTSRMQLRQPGRKTFAQSPEKFLSKKLTKKSRGHVDCNFDKPA